jgi:hypothetical protein
LITIHGALPKFQQRKTPPTRRWGETKIVPC